MSEILKVNLLLSIWLSDTESACQCKRRRFNPWVRKIPWRMEWQPTPVLLPGKFHGQRSLAGYSPCGCRVRHDWASMHSVPYLNSPMFKEIFPNLWDLAVTYLIIPIFLFCNNFEQITVYLVSWCLQYLLKFNFDETKSREPLASCIVEAQ